VATVTVTVTVAITVTVIVIVAVTVIVMVMPRSIAMVRVAVVFVLQQRVVVLGVCSLSTALDEVQYRRSDQVGRLCDQEHEHKVHQPDGHQVHHPQERDHLCIGGLD